MRPHRTKGRVGLSGGESQYHQQQDRHGKSAGQEDPRNDRRQNHAGQGGHGHAAGGTLANGTPREGILRHRTTGAIGPAGLGTRCFGLFFFFDDDRFYFNELPRSRIVFLFGGAGQK